MDKIGFIGLGAMGFPMAVNLVKKADCQIYGFDVLKDKRDQFKQIGGIPVDDTTAIYQNCDIVLQSLPNHKTVIDSVESEIKFGKKENIIIDLSSTAPDIIQKLYQEAKTAGISLIDSPVSGGVPMAEAGTLAIMAGGDKAAYEKVEWILEILGKPIYVGSSSQGSLIKLVNNMMGGAYLIAQAEAYAFAEKAGLDLNTVFEATRNGFVGGPLYENKIPKLINRDFEPGGRVAIHRKDIINAKQYAHKMGVDLPLTDVVMMIMDWMNDNGHINEDQIAMVKYYEDKMRITS